MLDWPTSSPNITRIFGFAVFGCWAEAGDRTSGERLVATSAAANKVRSKALGFGLTSLIPHSLRLKSIFVMAYQWVRASRTEGPPDASEPDVAGRGIDRLRMARGRAIAAAIVRRAEV